MSVLHAGLIAMRRRGYWRGVLITGPSGAGKSDLALRALDAGFSLVADDRTVIWTSGGRLYGKAPAPLFGLIEARGLGVVPECAVPFARIVLVAACEPDGAIERLPDREADSLLGLRIPLIRVSPLEPSAPAKLRRALMHLGDGD